MIRKLSCLLLAGLALAAQAAPETDVLGKAEPVHIDSSRNFGIDQGLPQASVNALLQGRDGYLWIGTYGGLVRFDGDSFKTFRTSPGGLVSNRILSLYEDRRGRLWIGTQESGIALYESGRFRPLDFCGGTCQVTAIRPSADGRKLWVLSPQGVFEFDPDTLRYRTRHSVFNAFGYIAPMADGNVYVAGGNGLARIGADATVGIPLPDGSTRVVMAGHGRYLWLVTDARRLYRYDTIDGAWRLIREGVSLNTRFTVSNDGGLLMSDALAGGIQLLHDDGSTSPLPGIPTDVHAQQAWRDDEGNLWIGSDTRGLWRIRNSHIGLMQSADVRMNNPGIAVVEDGEGGLWFGMACGGLRHWGRDGVVRIVRLEGTLGTECVHSLLLDDRHRLWIGTWDGTLGRLEDGRLTLAREWPQRGRLEIWRNPRDGEYWLGTLRDTWRLDVDAKGDVVDARQVHALDGMEIAFMAPARKGGTWFVGDKGAYRLVDGAIAERWQRKGIGTRFLRWLYEDPDDGTLWIGSYGGGLVRIHDGQVNRYDTSSGLFDDTVSCILPDAAGRLWLGGNNGVSVLLDRRIGARGPELIALSTSDGLSPAEMNGGSVSSCLRDGEGRLWYSLVKGFAVIDPARFDKRADPPIVHIERLRVDGRDLDPVRPETLAPNAGNLEIGYTAIGFASPERLRFRYRLIRSGSDWLDAGDRRNVLLPTLPWGEFVFEVQAKQLGSDWSKPVAIRLDHPMPWYRRQWIWLLISLACLLALLWAMREREPIRDYEHLLEDVRKSRRSYGDAP
ncbi:MAG: two-component regulator propeller domain-containing protein [Thermomonas sp.]